MDDSDSIMHLHGTVNDLSALDVENLNPCLRLSKSMRHIVKMASFDAGNVMLEVAEVSKFRDHLFCTLPSMADKINTVFSAISNSSDFDENTFCEIHAQYMKTISIQSNHHGCNTCDSVVGDINRVFDSVKKSTTSEQVQSQPSSKDSQNDKSSELDISDSGSYPELQESLALSRYSEISHADDWRLYFEESNIQSAKSMSNFFSLPFMFS